GGGNEGRGIPAMHCGLDHRDRLFAVLADIAEGPGGARTELASHLREYVPVNQFDRRVVQDPILCGYLFRLYALPVNSRLTNRRGKCGSVALVLVEGIARRAQGKPDRDGPEAQIPADSVHQIAA